MKTILDKHNIQLFLGALGILFLTLFFNPKAFSAVPTIHCETNFGIKSFTIEKESIAFHNEDAGRKISSVHSAKSLKTSKGLSKTLYVNGQKHFVHIDDLNHFNDSEDYMAITSPDGHKMTYPLTCSVQ